MAKKGVEVDKGLRDCRNASIMSRLTGRVSRQLAKATNHVLCLFQKIPTISIEVNKVDLV